MSKNILFAVEQTIPFAAPMQKTTDDFIELAQKHLVPAQERMGFTLVGAWVYDALALSTVYQILGFESLADYARFDALRRQDEEFAEYEKMVEAVSPECSENILEVVFNKWDEYRAELEKNPAGVYTMAYIKAHSGRMDDLIGMVRQSALYPVHNSRITFTGKRLTGERNVLLDLWHGHIGRERAGYRPADEELIEGMKYLRTITYHENIHYMYPLPYSPLK